MQYTLWFYEIDKYTGKYVKKYDIMTGTRYACSKAKNQKSFSWQYKVLKAIW